MISLKNIRLTEASGSEENFATDIKDKTKKFS